MDAILERRAVGDITGSLFVPAYQRGYRWGNEEVGRLLDDVWASGGDPYYLQPVVVKSLPDGRWELIDGQQRLTTLFLIFQYMMTEGLQNAGAGFTLEYETRGGSSDFLSNPSEDRRRENIDFHHIFAAYAYIDRWFDQFDHRKQWAANRFYDYLFESVRVIWYEAPKELDSIELFTRLNVGRIPLSDAELVKAQLLAKLHHRAGFSDRSEQTAAQWDQFERELRVPEVWSFVTTRDEDDPTRISLILDTLADRLGGPPPGEHRPRYYTFETLRPAIDADPQSFWDDVVALHSLIVGWYEDRDIFHKVGYLIATRKHTFASLLSAVAGLTRPALQAKLDGFIAVHLNLTAGQVADLDYQKSSSKCSDVLLLMNVETVRLRADSTERYSFHAHSRGVWSLEHIHAQNALDIKRDEKVWAEWLRLHRNAVADVPSLDEALRSDLLAEIDGVLEAIADPRVVAIGTQFDQVKARVEQALTAREDDSEDGVHTISNLALLASGDNSALSNSTFEVKRREIIGRDKNGSYIPACTRNVFLKYYTEADDQQIHFWGVQDREAYLRAILAAVAPYLRPDPEVDSQELAT
ncbi:hypothetical protein J2X63_002105 [Agromyces sp. 3263]|uniref:DUF262 domain-containing protein n=1 Tax=Agromyces sp. 3263 TaxID=2817750 RepID=UPI002859144D|nr:DUF262 domain-containing protein [Agromyces sp. 3263]MDR6906419.1 hypothetical protein [Agromyces sp. 3263]